MRRLLALAVSCSLMLGVTASPAVAASTLVDCKAGASLQAAIDAADPGDTLRIKGRCTGDTLVGKELVLLSGGGKPIIDGALTIQPPQATSMTVTLRGLRVTGLLLTGEGSRMTIRDVALSGLEVDSMSRVDMYDSSVSDGTGIQVQGGVSRLNLHRSTVSRNSGAGITLQQQGNASLFDSTVRDNLGVGISVGVAGLVLDHSTVRGNARGGVIGGQYLFVRNGSRIIDNHSSGDGGGILWIGGGGGLSTQLEIRDSVIARNTAAGDGGGIHVIDEQNASLEDVIIKGNTAGGDGGGIFADAVGFSQFTDVTFKNNTPDDLCVGC